MLLTFFPCTAGILVTYLHHLIFSPFFCFNTLRPGQNGGYFVDDNFKYIFFNEACCTCILIKISWQLVPMCANDNGRALVELMAWCQTCHHLNQCWPRSLLPYGITGPQWVKIIYRAETIHRHTGISQIQKLRYVSRYALKTIRYDTVQM